MLTEKFLEVLEHEGSVAIVSWSEGEPHMVNTWNSYINVTEDHRLLIPAAGMTSLASDIATNNTVKITLASREVEGLFALGCGFSLQGSARFLDEGNEFDMMKEKFSFLNRVLEITVTSIKQTL